MARRAIRLAAAFLLAVASPAFGRGGGGCLREGTEVLTPGGPVAVERLVPGDPVIAYRGGVPREARVAAVARVEPAEAVRIGFPGGALLVTATHPVAVGHGIFLEAGRLRRGDALLAGDGDALRAVPVLWVERVVGVAPAYDLLVHPAGTFLAAGALVHNKGCFLPDTPILLPDGSRKPIRDIRPGERVLAFGPDGAPVAASVRETLSAIADGHFLVATDRALLRVTAEHPFRTGPGAFKTVEALREGDRVSGYDGQGLSPQTVLRIERVPGAVRVFNLRTDPPHTFFASGIAVHNKGGGGGGGGRGGGFRSGGSRGSRGTGGGGDSRVAVLLFFGFTAVFVYAVIQGIRRARDGELDYLFGRTAIEAKSRRTLGILSFLARQDPAADPAALEARVRELFLKLQECWQAREYWPMAEEMVPFLHKEHGRQLAAMRRNHEINVLEGIAVLAVDLVGLSWTDDPDRREFTALITARARDYYRDDRTGAFLRGDRTPAGFQEFWTFQRRGSRWILLEIEQTKESDRLTREDFVESFTDLQLEQAAGGPPGKTGPAGPWRKKEAGEKSGKIERLLNFLVRTDRIWDRAGMIEAARRGFSDLYLSREAGALSDDSASRMSPDLAADFRGALDRQRAAGIAVEYRNFCVRNVDLVLVRNRADRAGDEYVARVAAHAQRVVTRNGAVVHRDADVVPFEEFLTFGRGDGRWLLKESTPAAAGAAAVAQENVDEDSSLEQLRWYYTKKRAL